MESYTPFYFVMFICSIIILTAFCVPYLIKNVSNGNYETMIGNSVLNSYHKKNKELFDVYIDQHYINKTDNWVNGLREISNYSYYDNTKHNEDRKIRAGYYNYNIYEFGLFLEETNVEVKLRTTQPCQFYSYMWASYLRENGIEYRLVMLPTHIFVIGYGTQDQFLHNGVTNRSMYIVFDGYDFTETYFRSP